MKESQIIDAYFSFLEDREFPCLAAKAALLRNQVTCMVAGPMSSEHQDRDIIAFLYRFIDAFRESRDFYHSAAVIFTEPHLAGEQQFETLLWKRLQALADIDAESYAYDHRVASDPSSPDFSFSLKEEAVYIIGMHPESSRKSRRFSYPALVFNPHQQFEQLREKDQYRKMQETVRKRDLAYSGSVNPMLADFGSSSEALQYSGREHKNDWKCPLNISHGETKHHQSS